MRILILVILTLFVGKAVLCDEFDPDYNYDKFMTHFGRTYTGEEKIKH